MKILKILFLFVFVNISVGFSQEYKVYNFNDFEDLLHKKDDKVYVVNFWATWCKPCVREMPAFNSLNEKYKHKNVEIILVSLDFGKNVQSRIDAFRNTHHLKSEIIILDDPDSNSWINKVDSSWSGAIPATLIYNRNKRIFYERDFVFNELEKEVLEFL